MAGNLKFLMAGALCAATALTGCGGGSEDGADDAAGSTTTTTIVVDNFFEEPLKAQAVVDKMVEADTPVIQVTFTQDTVSVQERGRPETYVVPQVVGPDDLDAPVVVPPQEVEEGEELPPAPPPERGVTVQRAEMEPAEFEELSAELAAIDERNSKVVSEEGVTPLTQNVASEPYRFGPDRVDVWAYDATSRSARRGPMALDQEDLEELDFKQFSVASIDWNAFRPFMDALLAELDLGDTEKVTNVAVSRILGMPPESIQLTITAEGERGEGVLLVRDGEVTIQRR